MTDSSVPDSGPGGHRGKLGLRKQALDIRCRRCCSCMATAGYANRPSRCSTRKGRHARPLTRLIRCSATHVANKKNCAISHPLLNEGTFIREYSTIRPIRHISFKSFQCLLSSSLIVEYSRMHFPSLSSGCEIAQFLFVIPSATDTIVMLSSSC
jgi:hypothetical protein